LVHLKPPHKRIDELHVMVVLVSALAVLLVAAAPRGICR
jgi:hypothetical protein